MKVNTSSPVMITGATGFVAGRIVEKLLEAGLTVHCPVRDPDNVERLKHLTDAAEVTEGSLKFFKADLLTEGSYQEAMQGCTVVIHTASPFISNVDPSKVQETLLDPAVKGTQNVLNSVSKTPSVKRVVLTSSCYAMLTDAADCLKAPNGIVTEETWNTTASEKYNSYAYSKVVAEKEAWKMADAQSQYKLVVVNPSWVMGPGLKTHPSSESYGVLKMMGDGGMKTGCPDIGLWIVDVRDVAKAHLYAAFVENAEGRYIVSGHNTSMLAINKVLGAKYPAYPFAKGAGPKFLFWLIAPYIGMDRKQISRGVGYKSNLDNSKSVKDLEMEYQPMEKTFPDMFSQMIEAGMIAEPK